MTKLQWTWLGGLLIVPVLLGIVLSLLRPDLVGGPRVLRLWGLAAAHLVVGGAVQAGAFLLARRLKGWGRAALVWGGSALVVVVFLLPTLGTLLFAPVLLALIHGPV